MGTTIVKKPEVLIDDSVVYSTWNAVHQPIIFELNRRDGIIFSVVDDGSGNAKFTLADDFALVDLDAGDSIIVVSNNYTGTFTCLSSTPPFEFILDTPFVGTSVGYVIFTTHKNWYLKTEIKYFNEVTLAFETVGTMISKHDPDYSVKINVAPFLKKKINMQEQFLFNVLNKEMQEQSGKFSAVITEYYNDTAYGGYSEIILGNFNYLNSIRQIQSKYGSNHAENLLMIASPQTQAKWLSAFKKPTLFKGFPFSLSFIRNIEEYGFIFVIKDFIDSNGATIVTTNNALVNTKKLLNRLLISSDSNSDLSTTIDLRLAYDNNPVSYTLTTTISIDVDNSCKKNPIYLNWIHTDGSRAFWLFDRLQAVNIETKNNSNFQPYIENLETQSGDVMEIENNSSNFMVVGAFLPKNKIDGIASCLYSINCLMLMNPETWSVDGAIWQVVRPVKGTFKKYDTDQENAEIQFSIQLVDTLIQSL